MQPLHELAFPLKEDSFTDDIQPVQQRQMQVDLTINMSDISSGISTRKQFLVIVHLIKLASRTARYK